MSNIRHSLRLYLFKLFNIHSIVFNSNTRGASRQIQSTSFVISAALARIHLLRIFLSVSVSIDFKELLYVGRCFAIAVV